MHACSPHPKLQAIAVILCGVLVLYATDARAQQKIESHETQGWFSRQQWPIHAFLYGGALGFAPGASHVGAAVGSRLTYWERGPHSLLQSLEIGFVHQDYFARGGTLDTSLAYRYCLRGVGLCGQAGPLLGGELLEYPGEVYGANAEGQFVARQAKLEPNMRLGVAVTIEQELCTWTGWPVAIFASYREVVLTGFLPDQGLPLFARTQLGGGVSIRPRGCA